MQRRAIVLLSGGQDSTTCLLMAIDKMGRENVYPITFFYGQRHKVELEAADTICQKLEVRLPCILPIEALKILGGATLTDTSIPAQADSTGTGNKYAEKHGLPPTVVPGRNLLFLTLAAAYGAKLDIYELWTGGCLADYNGYPDCRPEFYQAAEDALYLALDEDAIDIVTPLVLVSKADTFRIADELGQLDLIINFTHTCYNGERKLHDWGRGCGKCPACKTREAGWVEFKTPVTK